MFGELVGSGTRGPGKAACGFALCSEIRKRVRATINLNPILMFI
jgi:hypothetical protein